MSGPIFTPGAKSHDSLEGLIKVQSPTDVVIKAVFSMAGDPVGTCSTTVAIDVGGSNKAQNRFSWQNNEATWELSAFVHIDDVTSVRAYEVTNTHATMSAVQISVRSAEEASASIIT
jgi:hypothetical protein